MKELNIIWLLPIILIQACAHMSSQDHSKQLSARLSIPNHDKANTVFYLTLPQGKSTFPIAVVCEGSSLSSDLESVWSLHQYVQKDLESLGLAVLTIEKHGVDGQKIDRGLFFEHYTRSERLRDHLHVINHLLKNPPIGFDGRLIFIGASEGGPLVNLLSIHYPQTIATINWSGAGDWSWPDELWAWIKDMRHKAGFAGQLYAWWQNVPKTRENFDVVMAKTLQNPSVQHWFMGMTYGYHADAIRAPVLDYQKIHSPLLIVCGTRDSLINSCDAFVEKAKNAWAPVTYWRVEGMEHRISQNKENLIPRSFEWLKQRI